MTTVNDTRPEIPMDTLHDLKSLPASTLERWLSHLRQMTPHNAATAVIEADIEAELSARADT